MTGKTGLKLHSFLDPAGCRKCPDKGIYYDDDLVGVITVIGGRWSVWRVRCYGHPVDPAKLAMYEECMEHIADFASYHEARKYVKGVFCKRILLEVKAQNRLTG